MSLFQVAWSGLVPFGGFAMGAATDLAGVTVTSRAAPSPAPESSCS